MSGGLIAIIKFFVIRYLFDWNYVIRKISINNLFLEIKNIFKFLVTVDIQREISNLEKCFMLLRTIKTSTSFLGSIFCYILL